MFLTSLYCDLRKKKTKTKKRNTFKIFETQKLTIIQQQLKKTKTKRNSQIKEQQTWKQLNTNISKQKQKIKHSTTRKLNNTNKKKSVMPERNLISW